MKLITRLLLLFFVGFFFTACVSENEAPTVNNYFFSAKVDGMPFHVNHELFCYYTDTGGYTLVGTRSDTAEEFQLHIFTQQLREQTYSVQSTGDVLVRGVYQSPEGNYISTGQREGHITIRKYDPEQQFIEGSFAFTVVDTQTGDIKQLTEGVFRVKKKLF